MKQREILFILISGAILVVAWIIFTVIHSSVTSTITDNAMQAIIPIASSFDTATLQMLQKRQQIVPNFTISPVVSGEPTPTQIPTPTLTPTNPASESATSASGGAALQ